MENEKKVIALLYSLHSKTHESIVDLFVENSDHRSNEHVEQ